MRERNRQKINNLEGENRRLEKELRLAHREVARLRKMLDRTAELTSDDVEDSLPPIVSHKKPESCPVCKKTSISFMTLTKLGVEYKYLICGNIKCNHRSKVKTS